MPQLTGDPIIRHAWRPRADRDNIHYLAVSGGQCRHLLTRPGDPLYDVLAEALTLAGYPGVSYPGRARIAGVSGVPALDARCK